MLCQITLAHLRGVVDVVIEHEIGSGLLAQTDASQCSMARKIGKIEVLGVVTSTPGFEILNRK